MLVREGYFVFFEPQRSKDQHVIASRLFGRASIIVDLEIKLNTERKPDKIRKPNSSTNRHNYKPHGVEKSWLIQVAELSLCSAERLNKGRDFLLVLSFSCRKEKYIAPGRI